MFFGLKQVEQVLMFDVSFLARIVSEHMSQYDPPWIELISQAFAIEGFVSSQLG